MEFMSREYMLCWWTGSESFRARCAVHPSFQMWAAIAGTAIVNTFSLLEVMYRCTTEVKNVFPVPPGESKKNNCCALARKAPGLQSKLWHATPGSKAPTISWNRFRYCRLNFKIDFSAFSLSSSDLSIVPYQEGENSYLPERVRTSCSRPTLKR